MKLVIAAIDRRIYEGDFKKVILPGSEGQLEILPGHAPLVSALKKGELLYEDSQGREEKFEIEKGFVEVNKSEVIVLL